MWTYDGEEWIDEGAGQDVQTPGRPQPRFDEPYPELQIVEIVPVRVPDYVPLPLPSHH